MINVTEVKVSSLTCGNYDFKMFRRNLMEKKFPDRKALL
jgi:hypothetical protein